MTEKSQLFKQPVESSRVGDQTPDPALLAAHERAVRQIGEELIKAGKLKPSDLSTDEAPKVG